MILDSYTRYHTSIKFTRILGYEKPWLRNLRGGGQYVILLADKYLQTGTYMTRRYIPFWTRVTTPDCD